MNRKSNRTINCSPDTTTMVFDNLFRNGKTYTITTLVRVTRCIGTIESVEDFFSVGFRNTHTIVSDIDLYIIADFLDTHTYYGSLGALVLHTVGNNIVDNLGELLGICKDCDILFYLVIIYEFNALLLKIENHLGCTVTKIFIDRDSSKVVSNLSGINFGITCKLIDKCIKSVGFVVDGLNVTIHLFVRIGYTVHDSFDISPDGCNGCLKIMRNIGNQLSVLFLCEVTSVSVFLELNSHGLKIFKKSFEFELLGTDKRCIVITNLDIVKSFFKLVDRLNESNHKPVNKQNTRQYFNAYYNYNR